jgi:hypothetical protein
MTWYSSNWKRRMPIAIDTSLVSSGSFIFSINLSLTWDDFWNNVRSDGFDAVIVDQNGNQPISFERVTWNFSSKQATFRANYGAIKSPNVIHQVWLYWDNPDQSSDLATTGLTSTVNGYIYLGAPFKNIVNLASQSGLSTVPTTIIQKDPDEKIDIWFPISQLLAPRSLPSGEHLDFKLVDYYDFEVLDSSGVAQPSMISLGETRSINGWVKCRIIQGTVNTDYVVRCLVQNTDLELFVMSCLLQVRKLLPT